MKRVLIGAGIAGLTAALYFENSATSSRRPSERHQLEVVAILYPV